jgi:transcription-repair coupling factor (superfamily II helicase)
LITTPPAERLAVKTFVLEWNETVVREACLREIRRGGQIYFVHNTIETIEKTAQAIRELVPEATVAVGHGQMRERELEQLMLDFYHRRFNVLVCTTIIESGIDVPTANTIIIDRADRFGLAQIHQLRGRVGRSHHRAYAYLITPPRKAMTADAVKRLEAWSRSKNWAQASPRHARSRNSRRRRTAWATSKAARSKKSATTSTWNCWSAPCGA